MIGEDPDLEKSGRMLNCVTEWNRDGITLEADQRHVRETLKGLELERANRSATPCAVDRRDEGKGESRRGQTQTGHKWEDANNSDDRDRPQMADDDDPDSQAVTNGGVTRYRALVARISYLSQDRPHLKFASLQVCCAMAKRTMRDMECVKRIWKIPRWKAEGEVLVPLDPYSDAACGGYKATRRSVSAGVIMRGAHCLKVWNKKQHVVTLSFAESELYAAVKTGPEGLGDPERGTGLGNIVWAELTPGCLSNDVLGQPQRTGQSEARRHAESVDAGGIQVRQVCHEDEGRHERERRRPDDETAGKAED